MGGHFDISGATWEAILAPRDHPGGPWERELDVVNNRIFVDFAMILGLVYVSFWGPKCLHFFLGGGWFPGYFFIGFWLEIWTLATSKSWFSHGRYCRNKSAFHGKRFLWISESIFIVCYRPWEPLSDFLGLENKLENEAIFSDVTDPEPGI